MSTGNKSHMCCVFWGEAKLNYKTNNWLLPELRCEAGLNGRRLHLQVEAPQRHCGNVCEPMDTVVMIIVGESVSVSLKKAIRVKFFRDVERRKRHKPFPLGLDLLLSG